MKLYSEIEIGDITVIPKGTEFWSIALQEMIIPTRDLVIKITNTCMDTGYIFGNIQVVFRNNDLARYIGLEKARGYMNQAHGDIGIQYDKLKDYLIN
jgi:hypothetical protein